MKRANESWAPPPKRGRGAAPAGKFAFKVLCPDPLVAAILGNNGQSVAQIQDSSGCHCNFSRRNEYFPNSNLRILVVSGQTPGDIMTCLDLVLDQVVNCCEEERQALEAQAMLGLEDGDFIDVAGDIRLCIAVTEFAAKGGREGPDSITKLQEEHGVRLLIQDTVLQGHQLVVLAGSREQLMAALEFFNDVVQAGVDEEGFASWAQVQSFEGQAGGWSKEGRGAMNPTTSALKNILFVGGLSQKTDSTSLNNYFSGYGEVIEADVKRDPHTQRSKGFGFVTFATEEPAEACLAEPKGHSIDGKTVELKRYGYSTPPGHSREPEPASRRPPPRESRAPTSEYTEHQSRGSGGGYARPSAGPSQSNQWSRPVGGSIDRHYQREAAPQVHYNKVTENVQWFGSLAEMVPAHYLDQDYCITCSLPSAQCGALIGRGGENINEVERKTGTKVQLTKKDQASDHRTLSIVGPLISVYAAHLLLMRDFNEALNVRPESNGNERQVEVQEIQKQIAALTQKMESVRNRR